MTEHGTHKSVVLIQKITNTATAIRPHIIMQGRTPCIVSVAEQRTSGEKRTGCVFCGFGVHLETDHSRFLKLKELDRKKYDYCFSGGEFVDGIWKPNKKGLGMQYVYDRLNEIYGEGFVRYK